MDSHYCLMKGITNLTISSPALFMNTRGGLTEKLRSESMQKMQDPSIWSLMSWQAYQPFNPSKMRLKPPDFISTTCSVSNYITPNTEFGPCHGDPNVRMVSR